MTRMRVGLDVGGTKTDAVAVDGAGTVVGSVRLPTRTGVDGVVGTVVDAVAALGAFPGVDAASFRSVGLGMPGQVRPGTMRVRHALNLGVAEMDVSAQLAPRLGLPVRVENDVKAAAVGAAAVTGRPSLAYLNLGTGVAAGIVVDGRLQRGAHGAAGEIGHIPIDPAGPPCRCGGRGCIEAFAGGASLAQRWGRPAELPVRALFDATDRGDERAAALRADLVRAVAAAVRILVLTTDVDAVVLGGGLTALADRLLPDVRRVLEDGAVTSAFLGSLALADRVGILPPGSPAAALGAAIIGALDPEDAAVRG